ncbi:PAB-dependent poly(A)-specific ribonuclease subunit PAN3 [Candida viswanathii]|uniref:PAN2-PAN3 deadenylation complex subunit PAN3 n=1 Tax=Candida viswanathii TaxID=5486 RepID=A0A367YH90_9ASCO|nr:PAB-dependent poly(A)-specific ribonuclease subunit PAN3 [Candida viswanathii]
MNINLDTAKETLCKNILIYGYCKFENKGCAFSHNRQQKQQQSQQQQDQDTHQDAGSAGTGGNNNNNSTTAFPNSATSTVSSTVSSNEAASKKKFNLNTPSFQPGVTGLTSKFATLSPKLKEIPVFKPENGTGASESGAPQRPFTSKKFNVSTPSFTPSGFDFGNSTATTLAAAGNASASPLAVSSAPLAQLQQQQQQQQHVPMQAPIPSSSLPSSAQQQQAHAVGLPHSSTSSNPYFPNSLGISTPTPIGAVSTPGGIAPPSVATPTSNIPGNGGQAAGQQPMYPLQYHLYAPAPPPRLTIPLQPYELNSQAMFIPNELREYLHKKNEASLQTLSLLNLPEHVNQYHSLVPIDKSYEPISKLWMGKNSLIFKVYSNYDGNLYVLRKIEPCNEIVNDKPFRTIKKWKSIKNANIVSLQDAFTTMAFNNSQNGNNSLCIIYDYYPNSVSLLEQHKKGLRVEPINEDLLWSYLIQLVNAISAIHENGLAAKSTIDLSKIVVTNKHRIRLGSVGISDILEYNEDQEDDIKKDQVQDIHNVAKVLIELSVLLLPANMRQSANIYNSLKSSAKLSEEFVNALQQLSQADESFQLQEFNKQLSGKMLAIINNLQNSNDFMEGQLGSELENARLFRLMTKLNYLIYDDSDKEGVKSGNDKILRLFLNYLYNSYDTSNNKNKKVLNLNKVLINLNKLDCGIDEKLLLINKDECIIISYKELKETIDNKFRLMRE